MSIIDQRKNAIKTPGFKPKKRLYAVYKEPAGYDSEVKDFEALEKAGQLKAGECYVVESVDMGSSHTDIYLQGVDLPLNSIAFDFYEMENGQLVEHDIYDDSELNPYIS